MMTLNEARHHRLYGDVCNFVLEPGGVSRRSSGALNASNDRVRTFERADEIRIIVDIGNDETKGSTHREFFAGKERERGGVLVPAVLFLGLALAGRLVEKINRVYIGQNGDRHTADT